MLGLLEFAATSGRNKYLKWQKILEAQGATKPYLSHMVDSKAETTNFLLFAPV